MTDFSDLTITACTPVKHGQTQIAFCNVRHRDGMILVDVAIHEGGLDGRLWAAPPLRPALDRDGNIVRDPKTQLVKTRQVVSFGSRGLLAEWSDGVIAAIQRQFPEILR